MECTNCHNQFCWKCFCPMPRYAHPKTCFTRKLPLTFYFLYLALPIIWRSSHFNFKGFEGLIYEVKMSIFHFAISFLYVITHGFWLCWLESLSRLRYNPYNSCITYCAFPFLVLYEITLQTVWYRMKLFGVLFRMIALFLLFVSQIPVLLHHEWSQWNRNIGLNRIWHAMLAFAGPLCSLIALFKYGYMEVFK